MRKFIVSDLHGNGDIYDSIMGYLDNLCLEEEVELYINGDLIDRGLDSFRIFVDVIERVQGKGKVLIHYLGGNHELMMYQALKKRKPGKSVHPWCDWMNNGGWVIEGELDSREDGEYLCDSFRDFLGDLKIYHVFDESIDHKRMVLVHAQVPRDIKDTCLMKIHDDNFSVFKAVWTRKEEKDPFISVLKKMVQWNRIGLDGYFTIKGHTPVCNSNGFLIDSLENVINIDGGCAGYAFGKFEFDHIPLLEVEDGFLQILVFNHNNEIEKGYYFDGKLVSMEDDSLEKIRKHLNPSYQNQQKCYQKRILDVIHNL